MDKIILVKPDIVAGYLVGHVLTCTCGWKDKSGLPLSNVINEDRLWTEKAMIHEAKKSAAIHNETFHVDTFTIQFSLTK
jgi:hypothetical protein